MLRATIDPMVRRNLVALAVMAAALVPAAGAGAAPTEVTRCNDPVDFNVVIGLVRNMRCRNAVLEMKRYHSSIRYRFTTPHGFHCKRASGTSLGGDWRCVRRSKVFRFAFGD